MTVTHKANTQIDQNGVVPVPASASIAPIAADRGRDDPDHAAVAAA